MVREAKDMDRCLNKYMLWYGQKLNIVKSSIHFSRNFHDQQVIQIMNILNSERLPSKVKHLGLSLLIPRSKNSMVEELKEIFFQKIVGWKAKILS